MTIDEIRERATKNLMNHKGFDRAPCEHIVDFVFTTEIVSERECFNCAGKGILKAKRAIEGKTVGELAWETILCVRCSGTGKLPPITIEQAIKRVME